MSENSIGSTRELTAKWYYKELWGWNLEKICTGNVRSTFLKALLVCANGDGTLSTEEKDWVIGRAATAGAPDSLLEELKAYPANEDITQVIAKDLSVDKSRRAVIYFAFKAALADGDIARGEIQKIYKVGNALKLSEDVIQRIEEHVYEEENIKQKRIRLCFPEGNPFGV